MARIPPEQAYPALAFRPRSRGLLARLFGQPAECAHLETDQRWMAMLTPDRLYLRGKGRAVREPARPDVSVCRACLLSVAQPELEAYEGRVVAFEPDPEAVSQYFFVGRDDFEPAGVAPEVAEAVAHRLKTLEGSCEHCSARARWLWLSRAEVESLDQVERIRAAAGQRLCRTHGAAKFTFVLNAMDEANLFYLNLPYGDSGAYLWI